jgi:hypothetical protein
VRAARRHVFSLFENALRKTDLLERQCEFERVIGGIVGRQWNDIEIVINRSNLVGLLWTERLLSPSMRRIVLPYVYKTVIQSWNCLEPYIDYVRQMRRGTGLESIT